ncbi:G-D-S-L family lipolytic protein [Tenacibaculum sp. UWU-22]|uniref:G-D-S-L family lipolytic protein n=1 Tax=Tenacibaculum sp. UWU-22 TaxID=3234187 RepID=UPI0034DB4D70
MKKFNNYLTSLLIVSLAFISCDTNNIYPPITGPSMDKVDLKTDGLDFSNYIAVGASFTAGFTDGALFIEAQKNSFPNILASKFAMAGGGSFEQPLMNDNVGGFVTSSGTVVQSPRLYFNGKTPAVLNATPTTIIGMPVSNAASLNNYGIPGAKSFHFLAPGYGDAAGLVASPPTANPYYVRMAPTKSTLLAEIASKKPTFFTLSEIGGNDVLGYATTGGDGSNPITPTATFNAAFEAIVNTLTANGAKGVVGNVPYITSLAHFTTVPYNPLDPSNADFSNQIPMLNTIYGALNQIFSAIGQENRIITFSESAASAVVIKDENLTDLSATIAGALQTSATFTAFVTSLGLPEAAVPLVAQLMGQQYGQARQATSDDLLLLTSSGVIGKVDTDAVAALITQSGGMLSSTLAAQFSVQGITLPLSDKWVLTPEEQTEIKTAIDAYNSEIEIVVNANENITLIDLNAILQEASTSGVAFDNYNMNTSLVFGGLISLDGVHLTARGYALMANKMLEAIDAGFGSNFAQATDGLAKADDYPTNYSPTL